jgi:CRP/FNR family cyclic AMP-dependent transcriptional regulator
VHETRSPAHSIEVKWAIGAASIVSPSDLARVPLFAELTVEELDGLRACLRRRRYGRGQVIFLQGDPGTSLYLIESGRVRIVLTSPEGKEVVLALLGPADFFGDLALLDGEPRSADAVAQAPSELVVLRRDNFLRFLDAHPRATVGLLTVLSRRLRHNAQLLQDAAFLNVPGRLARVILELAEAEGQPNGTAVIIPSRLTQTELAGMVGATRESVNKWLRSYERRGLIRCQRGRITVLNPDALRRGL